MAETEGRLNTRTGEYDFIGRSIPVYPQNDLDVPVGKQVLIKIKAPFGEKLSGRIMTKMCGSEKAFTMKIRIENNCTIPVPVIVLYLYYTLYQYFQASPPGCST